MKLLIKRLVILGVSLTACTQPAITSTPGVLPETTETIVATVTPVPALTATATAIIYPYQLTVTPVNAWDCRQLPPGQECSVDIRLSKCIVESRKYWRWPYGLMIEIDEIKFSRCMGG